MKILFMSSSFNGGGITSFGHEVANAYSKDNDLSIIIGSDKKVPINNEKVKKYYYNCDDISFNNAYKIIELINNTIQPELIIGSNARILPVIAQFLNDDIKIITISHSSKYLESDVAAVAFRHVDYIISGSAYNGRYMAKKFGAGNVDKVRVVYNFIKEHPKHEDILRAKKEAKELIIVYSGACACSKSPEIVLQTLRKLVKTDVNFKFYWMGSTMIHLSRHFPFLHLHDIRELAPNDPRIIFPGRLKTREEAEDLISSANIYFAPSRREGCPMAFLEAARVGTIAIVADFENFNREIVEKGDFGYVIHYNDIDDFANKIVDICRHHQDYLEVYDKAYDTYLSELNFETWKNRMDNLIFSEGCNHVSRNIKVSALSLRMNIVRLKWLKIRNDFDRYVFENMKVLLRFWRLKHKEFIKNNK